MDVSRRTVLASLTALATVRESGVMVTCALEESKNAFRHLSQSKGRRLVLVESGVGFAAEDLAWLRWWGISIGQPLSVRGPAWVRFDWPVTAMIRDFGRFCPVSGGTVIAWLGDIPVAVRRGPLVVLGSPLGPSLYAGDRDAVRLVKGLLGGSFLGTSAPAPGRHRV